MSSSNVTVSPRVALKSKRTFCCGSNDRALQSAVFGSCRRSKTTSSASPHAVYTVVAWRASPFNIGRAYNHSPVSTGQMVSNAVGASHPPPKCTFHSCSGRTSPAAALGSGSDAGTTRGGAGSTPLSVPPASAFAAGSAAAAAAAAAAARCAPRSSVRCVNISSSAMFGTSCVSPNDGRPRDMGLRQPHWNVRRLQNSVYC